VHLRDPDLLRDLRLRQPVEEAELEDRPLALVQRLEPRREHGTVLRDLVLVLLGPERLERVEIVVGRRDEMNPAIDASAGVQQRRPYVQGLLTNLLNPKAVLFTVAFFPQFINARASLAPQVLVLTILLVANGLVWGTGIVFMVDKARNTLSRPSVRRRLDQTFGAVFVALGARVALESR